jgi:hypothetical protein
MAGLACLGVAGAHEEPVRPGVEARLVVELGQVSPDAQQRLLRRVFGEVDVAQDPVRHGMEAVPHGDSKAREGLLVAVLGSHHEIRIHALTQEASARAGALTRYGLGGWVGDSIFDSRGIGAHESVSRSRMARSRPPVAGRP